MILVDTTVWIDFFSNRHAAHTAYLAKLIEQQDDICICGVVLTEILQGIKNTKEQRQVEEGLESLIFLEMTRETFVLAADIFRTLRQKGVTVRKTVDCMIAAVAIENNMPLLHNDRDFDFIKENHRLRIVNLK
jgi:predicted nucleic acid-binding protein